jgi:UDP-N-acetylmuramoyl-tripeptide--D-alanyl-D-alanine ligase
MATATALVLAAAGTTAAAGRLHVLLHILQQEHYETARLRLWVKRHSGFWRDPALALAGFLAVCSGAAAGPSNAAGFAFSVAACAVAAWGSVRTFRREQVKPLVFTRRATRLYVVTLAICGLPPVALALALGGTEGIIAVVAAVVVLVASLPWLLAGTVVLVRPIDQADARRFVRRARRKLADVQPLVVGITGSYGKTSTKACVAEVLELLGPSYPTPASFNSYLGVVRAINEGLHASHRSFVAEMGAYRRGDVAALCDLVAPTAGVLTAIGPAHLERFGSVDEIERAKGELAEALPPDGLFVTRADDERCRRVALTRARCRVLLFSVARAPDSAVWAEDIETELGRTRFVLCVRDGADVHKAQVRTRLLGDHNVANLLAAAAVGFGLGLSVDSIARALGRVVPTPHRLAPIVNPASGVVVIDDSYNANPQGAASALAVLKTHPARRRVLVTQGMVELGPSEEAENLRLGELAAVACDRAILIGDRRAQSVRDGLVRAGFPESEIVMAPDSRTAHRIIGESTLAGDVILFENDLPDVYAE